MGYVIERWPSIPDGHFAICASDMEQILLKAMRKAIIQERPLAADHIDEAYAEYQPRPLERAREKVEPLTT